MRPALSAAHQGPVQAGQAVPIVSAWTDRRRVRLLHPRRHLRLQGQHAGLRPGRRLPALLPPCVPGSKVFCPCTGEWLECDPVTGEFPYCKPGCIPGQTIYCPSGEQRICKADCTYDPCTSCPPDGSEPPPCTEECCLGDPVCVERPSEWVCSWAGREIVRVPKPCPVDLNPLHRDLRGGPLADRWG